MREHHVYCSSCQQGRIDRFVLDEASGRLDRLETLAIPDAQAPTISHPLALSRDRRFLYAAVRVPPYRIATFAISPADGSLEYRGRVATAGSLAYLTLDVPGNFLLGASLPDSLLVSHRIDPASGIVEEPVQVIRDVAKAHSIVIDSESRFAYAAALGEDRVRHLQFDSRTGTMSAADSCSVQLHSGAGPRHLAFDPRERFVYCLNETDGTIDALARDTQSGALSFLQTTSLFAPDFKRPANVRSADLAVDPGGSFLYASERSSSTIATLRIDPETGALHRLGSIDTEASPRGIRITPSGRWLLVAGELSGSIVVYEKNAATGDLRMVCRAPASAGANWIVMTEKPTGA